MPESKKGFTLTELMVSVLILTMVITAFLGSLNAYRFITSYSRHKIQAIYWAQRIMEEQRRITWSSLVSSPYVLNGAPYPVPLDIPNGRYSLVPPVITVTGLDPHRKRVQVEVDWTEWTPIGTRTMKEFCTTDIANEPQLN